MKYQFFIWFAGLRGAIAFALSLKTPGETGVAMFTSTLMIVYFTVLVEGGITIPLLRKLQIPVNVDYDSVIQSEDTQSNRKDLFQRIDAKYLHPFFTRAVLAETELNQLEMNPSPIKVDKGTSPGITSITPPSVSPSSSPSISPVKRRSNSPDFNEVSVIAPVTDSANSRA